MPWFEFFYVRSRSWCLALVSVTLLGIGAPRAGAAQLHVAAGTAWGRGGTGIAAEVGARREVGESERLSVGAAIIAGDAGVHFGAAEARVQLRLDPTAVFAPFLELGAGVLSDPSELRGVWSLSLGLAPRIGVGRRMLLAGAWSLTDGASGPYRVLLGL